MNRRDYLLAIGTVGLYAIAGCTEDTDQDQREEDTVTTTQKTPTLESGTATDTDVPVTTTQQEETDTQTPEADPAEFEIINVNHPGEVEVDEQHQFSLTVKNTGGQTGAFEDLLELSTEGNRDWENVGIITINDIAPGETATWESNRFSFETPATVQFRIGDVSWSYDVLITPPDPQIFAGTGEEVRRDVTIEGGLTVVDATHDGESNFQVSLVGESEFDDVFINVIGEFDGSQAKLVDEGEYILDVNADGSWEITIRQPRSGDGERLPVSYNGNGPDVLGPVQFSGTGVASGSHAGDSNFQVQIFPMIGSFPEVVFNEIGDFQGETTYSFDDIGWIDVNADGDWSVEFEN